MKPFVQQFLDYTSELESSAAFFRWSAFSCVAALLRDNVYLPDGPGRVYPNIYTLLLADSAMHRKARGPDIATKILTEVNNTKIIRGRTSIQAVIEDLGSVMTNKTTGGLIKGGSCILIADELASFIVKDPQSIPILTDIYDFREEWTSSLKGTGKAKISNLCISMLAGSNEEHLKEVYTAVAVYGGLLGRTFFVKPDEFREGNPLFGAEQSKKKYELKPLIDAAKVIAKIKGEMIVDPCAEKIYRDWYMAWRKSCRDKPDRTGVLGRIHTSVKKIATILAVSETYDREIRRHHVDEAIESCIALLPNYDAYSMSSGKSSVAATGAILLDTLWLEKSHTMSRRLFLQRNWINTDVDTLDKTVTTLEAAGYIEQLVTSSSVSYTMTKKCLEYYLERQGPTVSKSAPAQTPTPNKKKETK